MYEGLLAESIRIEGHGGDIIAKALDTMVIKGKYVTPMPFDDFELAIKLASKFANLCRLRDVPEERLKLVVDWIEDVKSLKDQATAAAAPPPMPIGPGGMPPAGPAPMTPDGGGAPPPMPPEMAAALPPISA